MKTVVLALLCALFAVPGIAGPPRMEDFAPDLTPRLETERKTFTVRRGQRGTTLPVPTADLIRLCGDFDGCTLRLGMFNWDNTGRVASRESLFFINRINRAWRASVGDPAGTDFDGATQHVMGAWACYFTDGQYAGFRDLGDSAVNFGLLSWTEYTADCFLTVID